MKIGMAGYPVPKEVPPEDALRWTLEEAKRLGLEIMTGHAPDIPVDVLKAVREQADSLGIEIEPTVGGVFNLAGPDAATALAEYRSGIHRAKILGGPYFRTGYGQLRIESSRFNLDIPIAEHLARLTASLREAAKVASDEGIVIAVENHCDFTGRELAQVLAAVDSPSIRAALDTGNSFTVFCEPRDDLRALLPYTVTTHLKDMKIIQHKEPGRVPFLPVGCALGDGHVGISEVTAILVNEGPRGRDIPLIVELGWVPGEAGQDGAEVRRRIFAESFSYLRGLVSRQ